MLDICQILQAAGHPFVPSEIVQIKKADPNLVDCRLNPQWVAYLEFHTCQRTEKIDAAGRISKLNNLIRDQEIGRLQTEHLIRNNFPFSMVIHR